MIEYTRKDIIMDPDDPRLEGAIGKKVYSSSDINLVLNRANECEYEMTLTQVEDVDSEPFTVMNTDGTEYDADFIIIKKEPELEYVPFESVDEFINAYDSANYSVKNGTVENKLLKYGGIWLKDNEIDAYCMVTEIWDTGVVIGNKNITIGETTVFNDITSWDELLENFTFLDGSPCGKEVK